MISVFIGLALTFHVLNHKFAKLAHSGMMDRLSEKFGTVYYTSGVGVPLDSGGIHLSTTCFDG